MKFDVLVDSAKKFSEVFSKDMDFIKTKLEAATEDSKEIKLNYGQLAALASTEMGRSCGLENMFIKNELVSEIAKYDAISDL